MLKVAHIAIVTPRKCGLYETTRELVSGIRNLKIDARIIDPQPEKNPIGWKGDNDRGVPVYNLEWAKQADIIVNHSGLGELEDIDKPIIHVAHGRPRHSFLSEASGSTPIYSYHYQNNKKDNLKAVVTFWREHKPYLDVMYPDKNVVYVQSPVDLQFWCPGQSEYDFAGQGGDVNFVCTDAFRDDVDCYDALNAFALYARKNEGCRIHVYGKPKNMKGWGAILQRIKDDGNLGIVQGWAAELLHVYRNADCVLTAHNIDVRTVREAMATGCPVVKIENIECEKQIKEALTKSKLEIRDEAYKRFNPVNTALQFQGVINAIH